MPIFDCSELRQRTEGQELELQDQFHHILLHGPGVFVLRNLCPDISVIDAANVAFDAILKHEKQVHGAKGDHFAPASNNSRIWNSFSKHCLQDPDSFFKYYSNPFLALVCAAYLGPPYRITTQVNIVKPGGAPQTSHRDYHLGFQTAERAAQWPRSMQVASQLLTLQGAIAHTDMPLESGPTRFLPFSQLFEEGFMAYRLPEFNEYFLANWVSLPLKKGDAVFFNPALFHAAGANQTNDFERSANLIQVSSAFGKPMETIDSIPLVEKCWDMLSSRYKEEGMSDETDAFVKALVEGYPFPTNLDKRPPAPGGMAPESEQDVVRRGLREGCSMEEVVEQLKTMRIDSAA
ncbi:hypothetical protein LTR50_004628 [Elasticomyces elasticus]|nr:hypothetical protein LTR50_004628 [Elasticomyces elasticus]